MKSCSGSSTKPNTNTNNNSNNSRTPVKPNNTHKPPFMPAMDDTKPVLQDPVLSLSLSPSILLHCLTWIVKGSLLSNFVILLILLCQILRSDPIETEEAVLRLPPFSIPTSASPPQM